MVKKSVSGRQVTERKQQLSVAHKTTVKSTKLNMDSKENVDMAFEINVPTGTDVQVSWRFISVKSIVSVVANQFSINFITFRCRLRLKMTMET